MRSLNPSTKALILLFSVSLTLGNDNELVPSFQFTKSQYNGTIHENSIGRTYVNTEEKMGLYKGEVESEVVFSIASGDAESFFKAEAKAVGDFCFLFVRTKTGSFGVLNRERKDKFVLKIIATTRVRVNKEIVISRNVTVNIDVLDTNDLSPLFYSSVYHEIVPESIQIHSSILKVQAEDADLGFNGEIYYSFLEKTEQFSIQLTSGMVVLSRPLNYSEKVRHELTVLAQDRGNILKNGTKISKAKLVINVVRGNLHSPEINVKYLTKVYQDSYADIFAIISITDQDEGLNGEIRHLEILQGNIPEYFKIRRVGDDKKGENEFNLVVQKPVEKEYFPLIRNLTIRVVDKGTPPRDTRISIPVHLTHIDDSQPVFNKEVYEVGLLENSPINTPIIRLKLSNANQNCKCQVHLEIVGGNEGGHFYINGESGMLYTATTLDAEEKSFYVLTVSAIDLGKSRTRKQSSAKVKINLIDTNDNDPIFENLVISVSIKENEPVKTIVTKVQAKDKDSGENSYISYSIANLNPMSFEIDHFSGTIRTTQVLDYETMKRQCILHIRASDWGVPYRRQTEMLLKVKLRDVNDNKPQFYRMNCTGTVSRSLPIGGEILTVTAIDFDAGNIISYRLAPDNDNCFHIDVVSGEITVSCNLEIFPASEVYLNVTATDGTHLSDTNIIHVKFVNNQKYLSSKFSDSDDNFTCKDTGAAKGLKEILSLSDKNNAGSLFDHNDFAMMPIRYGENIHTPQFIDIPKKVFINETAVLGSTVVKIHAKDRDLGFNGKLIYSISSGDQDSVFRMDPDSGEIRLVGYLDYEQNSEYYLNITVYDEGKPQKSTFDIIEIAIINVNDNAPKFQEPVVTITIPENVEVGTHIFQAFATDLDSTELVYSLMSYTEFFYIDEESGLITVQISPDREQNDFFELVVRCTDENDNHNQNLYSDSIVNIIVQDENDNLPKFPHEAVHIISREDVPIGTVVTVIEALDKDLGDSGAVSYMLHGELDIVDHFAIDSLTGFIRTTRKLDYEERQSYTLTVIALDHGSPPLSGSCVLVVSVTDVNENLFAPHFEESVVSVSVRENEPIGTVVASVKAVDSDNAGDDSRVGYTICNGDGLGYFSIDDKGRTTITIL